MRTGRWIAGGWALALLAAGPGGLSAQGTLPLDPPRPSGLAVSPIFEGWYRNPDGTYTLSFGYINRNAEEVLEVPVGPGNRFESGDPDRGQPTHFLPRRHYGVFTVTVPADFGGSELAWTLDVRGERFSIPGRLHRSYEIDALGAPATGVTPPALRLDAAGEEGRGPHGVTAGPVAATVGVPLELTAWAQDDEERTVTLRWAKYRGSGEVTFDPATIELEAEAQAEAASTAVSFSAPGEYVLHVGAHNSAVASAGHAQCCWTNGWVRVSVGPAGGP